MTDGLGSYRPRPLATGARGIAHTTCLFQLQPAGQGGAGRIQGFPGERSPEAGLAEATAGCSAFEGVGTDLPPEFPRKPPWRHGSSKVSGGCRGVRSAALRHKHVQMLKTDSGFRDTTTGKSE